MINFKTLLLSRDKKFSTQREQRTVSTWIFGVKLEGISPSVFYGKETIWPRKSRGTRRTV